MTTPSTGSKKCITLMSFGSMGDVMPFIRLGKILAERGHAVSFYGPSYFLPMAEKNGMATAAIGVNRPIEELHAQLIPTMTDESVVLDMAEQIRAKFTPCDLVIAHPLVTGFYPLAKANGWPFMTIFPAPAFLPSIYNPPFHPDYPITSKLAQKSPIAALLLFAWYGRQKKKPYTKDTKKRQPRLATMAG